MDRHGLEEPGKERGSRGSRQRPDEERQDASPVVGARPEVYFSVRLTLSGQAQDYEDPKEAGAAFFRADPSERPAVTHVDGTRARTMARTELHGLRETGEPRYVKVLPDSHAPDAAFRAGFLEAMEASLTERLGALERSEGRPGDRAGPGTWMASDLREDLEAFGRLAPERAAALRAAESGDPAAEPLRSPGSNSREGGTGQDHATDRTTAAPPPAILAAGDWVTTDQDVELRPLAARTEAGIHTGYEARLPDVTEEITISERTFGTEQDALRHAWDFYEGGEAGLESAVASVAALGQGEGADREREPEGLVIEHRPQPEFPRPEAAILAGEDGQLVLTLGRDTESTRDLAERLVADPAFRNLVAEHIPDVEATIGTGRFIDVAGSFGFLPDELLSVTSYARDGSAEVLVKFPDESPLSYSLAHHLRESPVVAAHLETSRAPEAVAPDPARMISDWVVQAGAAIDRLPPELGADLREEMQGIAREAAAAFGIPDEHEKLAATPRSTLYATAIRDSSVVTGGDEVQASPDITASLKFGLAALAAEAGIDPIRLNQRLVTGAKHAQEEEGWVRGDIADVAARHRLDLGDDQARSQAAGLVDRFYDRAADLIHAVRGTEIARETDPLVETLGALAKAHGAQGAVSFRSDDQARDFADAMTERFGTSILRDIASGRTEGLAGDLPDPGIRQALAAAVVAVAQSHPGLGLEVSDGARDAAPAASRTRQDERSSIHARDHEREY